MAVFDDDQPKDPQEEARMSASYRLRQHILHLAVEGYGATRSEVPIPGYTTITEAVLDDPLAGIRAAIHARNVAAGEIERWVKKARAAGKTWAELADVFGVKPGDDDRGRSPAEVVFEHVAENVPLPWEPSAWARSYGPSVRWQCPSCGQTVKDTGPYAQHPDDTEQGHADTCARHQAEVSEFERQADEL